MKIDNISVELNEDAVRDLDVSKFDADEMQLIDDILTHLVTEQLDHFKHMKDFNTSELAMMSRVDIANATINIEKLVCEKR